MNAPIPVKTIAVRIGRNAVWAPLAVIVAHSALGGMFGHEPYVDPVMHFLGGVAAAFFFRYACSHARPLLGNPNSIALDLLAFGLASVAALAWEMGEFASDLFLGTRIQRDVANTMRDLILGVGGGALYLATARVVRSGRTPGDG